MNPHWLWLIIPPVFGLGAAFGAWVVFKMFEDVPPFGPWK